MKDKHTIKRSTDERHKGKTDWKRVDALSEEEIEEAALSDADAQPTTADFWKNAELVMPKSKQSVTIRLDQEVLKWYKGQGKGYQTRINAVLRAYMETRERIAATDHRPNA